jgi:hypothetical protein
MAEIELGVIESIQATGINAQPNSSLTNLILANAKGHGLSEIRANSTAYVNDLVRTEIVDGARSEGMTLDDTSYPQFARVVVERFNSKLALGDGVYGTFNLETLWQSATESALILDAIHKEVTSYGYGKGVTLNESENQEIALKAKDAQEADIWHGKLWIERQLSWNR